MKSNFITLIILSIMLQTFTSCGNGNSSKKDIAVLEYAKANDFPIKSNSVRNADPAFLFCYANHLWENKQKDEAVFWYYVAQYRYRFLSVSSEEMKAGSFDEAFSKEILLKTGVYKSEADLSKLHLIGGLYRLELYKLIQAFLGKKINIYAYGNLELVTSTLDSVLEYEEQYPFNPLSLPATPVLKSSDILKENLVKVRESYINEKQYILEHRDEIIAKRAEQGLDKGGDVDTSIQSEDTDNDVIRVAADVDEKPIFNGSSNLSAFDEYLNKNITYPPKSENQGRVAVEFVIEKDGSISNAKIVSGIDPLLDAEALRVVNSSPKWTPAKIEGKAVRMKTICTVRFRKE